MARAKKNIPPGRKSAFVGEKQDWLEQFRDQLRDAADDPGTVYDDATNAFLLRYGYDLPFTQNVDGKPEDNPPNISPNPDKVEKTRRDGIQKKLRAKLSNYFRNRWRGKKVHTGAIQSILGTMQTMSGPSARPRRKPAIAVYSKLHYAERIKPKFDELWAKAKDNVPAGDRFSMSQDFVRSSWEAESDDFKASVVKKGEEMYEQAMADWKAARKVPEGSAEEYHNAMETLTEVGIPMADALAERLGSHVVILVVGPVGSEKGEVCLRTVFSDTSNLQTSRTWAQFDHKGFTAMENSITRYGRAAFSKAECEARAWPPVELDNLLQIEDEALPGSGSSAPPAAPNASTVPNAPPPGSSAPPATPNTSTVPNAPPPGSSAPPATPNTSTVPNAPPPGSSAPPATPNTSTVPNAPPPGSSAPPATPIVSAPPPANASAVDAPSTDTPPAADGVDRSEWSKSLVLAHAYLSGKDWGPRWTKLLDALVQHEWSFRHPEDDGNLPKGAVRPQEFANWFKEHRVYDDYPVSANFGEELLAWWKYLGPGTRWDKVETSADKMETPSRIARAFWVLDWCKLHKRGRNGPVLLLLGLAWWGQSICNAAAGDGLGAEKTALEKNELWNLLADDVCWVLTDVLTQSRATMELAEAEKAREAEEAEQERVAAKKAPKGKRGGKKAVAEEPGPKKRKRGLEDDSRASKRVERGAVASERPKPRPVRKPRGNGGAGASESANQAPADDPQQATAGSGGLSAITGEAIDEETAEERESPPSIAPSAPQSAVALEVPPVITAVPPPLANAVTPAERASSPTHEMDVDIAAPEPLNISRDYNMLDFDPFAMDTGYTAEELEAILDPDANDEEAEEDEVSDED
ncbi:hypothetical protein R3P38DRAFT_3175027 [Favolaschia claudopus]|uniref:Uncharacterized protein n=1 Tax=Favolaschia claudopus TaxID=2862362 RepID=A0AAW0DD59_9AGAR